MCLESDSVIGEIYNKMSMTTVAAPAVSAIPIAERCPAECCPAAQAGAWLFRYRSWIPLMFLAVPLLAPGRMTPGLWLAGLALVAAGEGWRLFGIAAAGTTTRRRSRNVQRLVTYGAFAWSRNPLYAGNFLIWMGFVLISGVLWFLPIAVLLFAVEYSLIVRYEEGVLESTFGEEYLAYKRHTPRWIPRVMDSTVLPSDQQYNWREAFKSEISTVLQYVVLIIAFAVKYNYR